MPRKPPRRPVPGDTGRDVGAPSAQDITVGHGPVAARRPTHAVEEEEDPPGSPPRRRAGKIAAVVATLVMLGGVIGVGVAITALRDRVPVTLEGILETVDSSDGCTWQLVIELRNKSDETVTVSRVNAILNQGNRGGSLEPAPPISPGATRTLLVDFRLPKADPCPEVEEINHGDLIFHLKDQPSVSIRF